METASAEKGDWERKRAKAKAKEWNIRRENHENILQLIKYCCRAVNQVKTTRNNRKGITTEHERKEAKQQKQKKKENKYNSYHRIIDGEKCKRKANNNENNLNNMTLDVGVINEQLNIYYLVSSTIIRGTFRNNWEIQELFYNKITLVGMSFTLLALF